MILQESAHSTGQFDVIVTI